MIIPILRGGLGNQMFQIANAYAFAKRHNYNFGINYSLSFSESQGNTANKYRTNLYSNIPFTDNTLSLAYKEPTFGYTQIPPKDDIMFAGFYQSEKYFCDYSKEVKNLFTFPGEIKDKVDSFLKQFDKPIVSIHIRRGDYLRLSHFHRVVDAKYYLDAAKLLRGYQAIICTDDIESVKKEMNFSKAIFSPFKDEIEDLYLLSQCDSSIICNSSFSWWGAYLGRDKKIVTAPKEWFGTSGPQDYQDIYNDGWILL